MPVGDQKLDRVKYESENVSVVVRCYMLYDQVIVLTRAEHFESGSISNQKLVLRLENYIRLTKPVKMQSQADYDRLFPAQKRPFW